MENQMKRGLLDVCVLAAIKNEDSYGYQIIKDMSPYVEISESTLYPILRRLENQKMLTVRTAEHNGRLRKYYGITVAGLERLNTFEKEWKELITIYEFVTKGPNNGKNSTANTDQPTKEDNPGNEGGES